MCTSFIGEIRAFPYSYCPDQWAICAGQSLLINQYQALFSVIGFTYGGNNNGTFCLPNLQAASVIEPGSNGQYNSYTLGKRYGEEGITLNYNTLPSHMHNFIGKGGVDPSRTSAPATDGGSYLSNLAYRRASDPKALAVRAYRDVPSKLVTLHPATISSSLASDVAPHENRSPFLAMRYCICLFDGDYPMRP